MRRSSIQRRSILLLVIAASALIACEASRPVIEQEFLDRGLDYPIHVHRSRPDVPRLVKPGEFGERAAPELDNVLASGWQSFLAMSHDEFVRDACPSAEAFELGDPILFQDAGHMRFGVTLTCYGVSDAPHRAAWNDTGELWTVANIALFRDDGEAWTMDGWVY